MKTREPLSPEMLQTLQRLRGEQPICLFARRLNLSTDATMRALGGLSLLIGTRAHIAARVQEMTLGNGAQVGEPQVAA